MLVGLVVLAQLGDFGAAVAPFKMPRVTGASARDIARSADAYRCLGCSVVLISIDTLRADHLGVYGYQRPTSPAIDRFAGEAARFRTAIVSAPSTLRSHASMLTSMYPRQHKARRRPPTPLTDEALTLTEVLRDSGYQTASFNAAGQIAALYGLGQGFDRYDDFPQRSLFAAAADAIDWLDEEPRGKFFLFLHTYEVHAPYTPADKYWEMLGVDEGTGLPSHIGLDLKDHLNMTFFDRTPSFTPADARHVAAAYDAEIRSVDDGFAFLVEQLRARGLYEDLLIVFTADHGEEMGDRSQVGRHSHSIYDEVIKVPLLIKFPGGAFASTVVSPQVRTIDIAPTITDVLELDTPASFFGDTVVGLITGTDRSARLALIERVRSSAVRTDRWKYMDGALYDLAWDPGETEDVGDDFDTVRRALQAHLDALAALPGLGDVEQIEMTEEVLRQLRALGYVR